MTDSGGRAEAERSFMKFASLETFVATAIITRYPMLWTFNEHSNDFNAMHRIASRYSIYVNICREATRPRFSRLKLLEVRLQIREQVASQLLVDEWIQFCFFFIILLDLQFRTEESPA